MNEVESLDGSFCSAAECTAPRRSQAGVGRNNEASPTDRVEKLLKKYKVRSNATSSRSSSSSFQEQEASHHHNKLVLVELELWATLNDQLRSKGYKGVEFEQISIGNSPDCLALSVPSSTVARLTISCLLKELEQRDETIRTLRPNLSRNTFHGPIRTAQSAISPGVGAPEADHVITELKSQVARMEYENARLRVDLQNKPCLQELCLCQRKVKELEVELLHTRLAQSRLSNEHSELLQCQQQIKDICSVISVSKGVGIIPKLKDMKAKLESHMKLEKQFSSLMELVYHHSNPQLSRKWERSTPPHPSGHDLWCGVTWSHMIMTLQEWAYHLQGLKELQQVLGEVCQHLEMHSSPTNVHCATNEHRARKEGEDQVLWFSCQEMAALLRRWLMKKSNMKSVSVEILLAMVRHFQHLFGLSSLEGIYPTMNMLSQQIEQHRNVQRRLRELLKLGDNCSPHKLVSTVELVVLKENSEFMDKIGRYFGPKMDLDRVIEKLRLCEEFFPTFHALVLEIQTFLGVNSLSEIIPALYKLPTTT